MDLVWWMTNVVAPYLGFVNSYYGWLSVATCLVTAVSLGLTYERLEFGVDERDFLWLLLIVGVITLVFPFLSVLILVVIPLIVSFGLVVLFGAAVFFTIKLLRTKLCR